jgi:thiol:disulfide interchange protein DsbD
VVQRLNQLQKEVCGQSFLLLFIRICGLTNSLCFPMIPMTVSFLPSKVKNKAKGISNAIVYGVSIIVIYVLLGF